MICELSIVIPTFNESDNIRPLIEGIEKALGNVHWEVIIVDDDSPDGTHNLVREIALSDPRVRLIRRVGRRGLSSAAIDGMMACASPYIAVMDADLQHDEALLPNMLGKLKEGGTDIVVGCRYMESGGVGDWSRYRIFTSRLATRIGQAFLKVRLRDPMSGFFMLERRVIEDCVHRLSGFGFKILLDIVLSLPIPPRVVDLPFQFRLRHACESKLDTLVAWEFFMLLLDKSLGQIVPIRFIGFVFNGGVGALLHLAVLGYLLHFVDVRFLLAQTAAALVAMVNNFFLNNLLTYRDRRYRGLGFVPGLAKFALACAIGAVANVGVADFLFGYDVPWYLAGFLGAVIGAVWNFAIAATMIWRQ